MKKNFQKTISIFLTIILLFLQACTNTSIFNAGFSVKDLGLPPIGLPPIGSPPPPIPADCGTFNRSTLPPPPPTGPHYPYSPEQTLPNIEEDNGVKSDLKYFSPQNNQQTTITYQFSYSKFYLPPNTKLKVVIEGIFEKELPITSDCTPLNFLWDGKDYNKKIVDDGEYTINFYLTRDSSLTTQGIFDAGVLTKKITYTRVNVTSEVLDKNTTKFMEVEDFKKLSDYTNQLNISDDIVDSLYTKIKGLEILEKEKSSLLARNTQPIAKIQEVDNKIAETNAVIAPLQSNIMVALSDISNKNDTLVNQVNSITQTSYITPYPPEEKPTSVGEYFDSAYFSNQDLSNILTDGATLYSPDPDDPIQDDLKEAWQVSPERVEVNDPSQVFDGSKYLSNEIQTAKDLMTDYLNGVFDASGNNGASEKSEAINVLKDLVTQIKTHTGLLKTRAKIYHDDLSSNFEKLKEAEAEQFQSIILPLANAMEQEGEYADDTYIRKVQSMTIQSFKTMDFKAWQDWAKTKYNLGKDFWNSNLGKREKVIAIVLGYTLDDWNALKKQDPKAADELVVATSELIEAVGIPTSYTSAAITFAGPIAKFTGKIGKIASNVLGKKLPPNQSGYIKKLLENIKLTKEKIFRWIGKTPAKVVKNAPCFNKMSIQSFNTQAINLCPLAFLGNLRFPASQILNRPIYRQLLTPIQKTKFKIAKFSVYLKKGYPKSFLTKYNNIIDDIIANGVDRKAKTGFPDFDRFVFRNSEGLKVEFKLPFGDTFKSAGVDFLKADKDPNVIKFFIEEGLISADLAGNSVKAAQAIKKVRSELNLTWHHHEDLKTLQLLPRAINEKIQHLGGASVQRKIDAGLVSKAKYENWRTRP